VTNSAGETCLHRAAASGYLVHCARLISLGAVVNAATKDGLTALHVACQKAQIDIVRSLLEQGADIYARSNQGHVVDIACRCSNLEMLQLLIDRLDATRLSCSRALRLVCRRRDCRFVRILLDYHLPDIHSLDERGQGPLHYVFPDSTNRSYASSRYYKDTVPETAQLLLKYGANVHVADAEGTTALHQACKMGDVETVQLLLDHGAAVNHSDNKGMTALHLAGATKNSRVLQLLLDRGADINIRDNSGRTMLEVLCGRR
jgi:ankyrin repeat protein